MGVGASPIRSATGASLGAKFMSSSNSVAVTVEDDKMRCEVFDAEGKTLEC